MRLSTFRPYRGAPRSSWSPGSNAATVPMRRRDHGRRDRLDGPSGIAGGVLSKAPRDIIPRFVHGTSRGRRCCARRANDWRTSSGVSGGFVTSVGIEPRLGYKASVTTDRGA